MKLVFTNLGEMKTAGFFSHNPLSSSPLHNPSVTKATLISLSGTERLLQLTSLARLRRNHMC